jgi:hypothetical protein
MSEETDPYDAFHVVHPLYLKGVQREQERIIALLQNISRAEDSYDCLVVDLDIAIGSIKGELH